MKCKQCDEILTDFESTRQDKATGEYMDLCNNCFRPINKYYKVKERHDLLRKKDIQNLDEPKEETDDETLL